MTFGPPTIYFDHWAIRAFSERGQPQDRFVDLLHRKAATFVLSLCNLAEFSAPSDRRHAIDAEHFLDRLMPNIYLTDFDLDRALRMEGIAQQNNLRVFMPHCDWLARKVLERTLRTGEPLSLRGLLSEANQAPEFTEIWNATTRAILDKILELRDTSAFVSKARSSIPSDDRPKVHVVLGELMRDLILNPGGRVTQQDAADLLHAALPSMGCDFVLLDGRWVSRVETMRRRLAKHCSDFRLARCFSKRDEGLSQFLDELDALPEPALPGPTPVRL